MNNTNTEKTLKDVVTGEVVSVEDPTYSGCIKVKITEIKENVEIKKSHFD